MLKKMRQPIEGETVKVYFHFRKKLFSIVSKGNVIAHLSDFSLRDATFSVSQLGRARVIAQRKKNVHAWIIGVFSWEMKSSETREEFRISYNPYKDCNFLVNGEKIEKSNLVYFKNGEVFTE